MPKHPFEPLVSKHTRKLIVGTLPPENVPFYFSNSSNTRLWDFLQAILTNSTVIGKGGIHLSVDAKKSILDKLNLGISDIIYEYQRDVFNSTSDEDINPKSYNKILALASSNNINELLFVYASAYKWFIHSLSESPPVKLKFLKGKIALGVQESVRYEGKIIKCTLLPSPLNRGRAGETLERKLEVYRFSIKNNSA